MKERNQISLPTATVILNTPGKLAKGDSNQVTDMELPNIFAKFANQIFLSSHGSSTSLLFLMSRHYVAWGCQSLVLILTVFS